MLTINFSYNTATCFDVYTYKIPDLRNNPFLSRAQMHVNFIYDTLMQNAPLLSSSCKLCI